MGPYVSEKLTAEQEKYYMAGQWKLMWWRFRRHRPAVVSAAFLVLMYFSCSSANGSRRTICIPGTSSTSSRRRRRVHLFHEGRFLGPFVYGLKMERDLDTLQRVYTEDHASRSSCASSAAARPMSSGA